MRLVTYDFRGARRLAAQVGEKVLIDLNRAYALRLVERGEVRAEARALAELPPEMLGFLDGGEPSMVAARHALAFGADLAHHDPQQARGLGVVLDSDESGFHLLAPIPEPRQVLAVAVNYRDHAAEMQRELPLRPKIFAKVATCIVASGAPILRPRVSSFVDWEGELCVVIGRRARNVAAADALDFVAGYTIGNDVTARDWQLHSPTLMMGKSFDSFGPLGPALVTRDEVPDPQSLEIRTLVNGVIKQDSNTRHMLFGVAQIIEYLSAAFTLRPGDVLFTGTPPGVGAGREPPESLAAGDVVRVEISGLGALENPVVEESA